MFKVKNQTEVLNKPTNNESIIYHRITGFCKSKDMYEKISHLDVVKNVISGLAIKKIIYLIKADNNGIEIFVGALKDEIKEVMRSYTSFLPGLNHYETKICENKLDSYPYSVNFSGIPVNINEEKSLESSLNGFFEGAVGLNFALKIEAEKANLDEIKREMKDVSDKIKTISQKIQITNQVGKTSFQISDYDIEKYVKNLKQYYDMLEISSRCGGWRYSGTVYGDNDSFNCIKNLYISSLSGEQSYPKFEFDNEIRNTLVSNTQMSMLMQLPTIDLFGFSVSPAATFDRSNSKIFQDKALTIGQVCTFPNEISTTNNYYNFPLKDLDRHALVVGMTGSGKTNTTKSLIYELHKFNIPFLVIESAKKEYWNINNIDGMSFTDVYTLGNNTPGMSRQLRINPFSFNEKNLLQSHIDSMMSIFKSAFELEEPLPFVLERAIYEVYKDCGWDVNRNIHLTEKAVFPTLSLLLKKVQELSSTLNYEERVKSNVRAALESRIGSLMIGGKGVMLNSEDTDSIANLLKGNVVLELDDIGDDDTKSFIMGVILSQIYEYYKDKGSSYNKLRHVIIIEEAHRLLKRTEIPIQAKAVNYFCDMLCEIRSYGEGIIVCDQSPTKLAKDIIKNTNLKIVHRLLDKEDREAIGFCTNMTEEQIAFLSQLKRGYCAVYSEGDTHPKCVKVPLVNENFRYSRYEVIKGDN